MKRSKPPKDDRTLYRIDHRVRPSEDHPRYGQSAGGILSIWVFDHSSSYAAGRSLHHLQLLPFQAVGREMRYEDEFDDPPNEAMKILIEMVMSTGIAHYYFPSAAAAADIKNIPFPGEEAA